MDIEEVKAEFRKELGREPDEDVIEILGGDKFFNDAVDELESEELFGPVDPEYTRRVIRGLVERYKKAESVFYERLQRRAPAGIRAEVEDRLHRVASAPLSGEFPQYEESQDLPVESQNEAQKKIAFKRKSSYETYLWDLANCLEASQDSLVKLFRAKYLPNGLLKPDEVGHWIREQQEREKDLPSEFITIILPPGHKTNHGRFEPPLSPEEISSLVIFSGKREYISYATPKPDSNELKWDIALIAAQGVLHELHQVAGWLSSKYDWDKGDAVMFILANLCPIYSSLSIYTLSGSNPRIEIKVRPEVGPEEVKRAYSQARQKLLQEKFRRAKPRSRIRPIGAKSFELAKFVLAHPELSTWEERRREWNRKYHAKRKWQYWSAKSMREAYTRVRTKLHLPTAKQIEKLAS